VESASATFIATAARRARFHVRLAGRDCLVQNSPQQLDVSVIICAVLEQAVLEEQDDRHTP
jgi:hypothetical protein